MNIEKRYQKCIPIIKNSAKYWQNPSIVNLQYDDLISYGNEIFLKCYKQWDKKRSFYSYLKGALNKEFKILIKKEANKSCFDVQSWSLTDEINNEQAINFKIDIDNLSGDSKIIVNSALNTPMVFIDHMKKETGAARLSRHRIKKYFVEEEGWSVVSVRSSFDEIKNVMTY